MSGTLIGFTLNLNKHDDIVLRCQCGQGYRVTDYKLVSVISLARGHRCPPAFVEAVNELVGAKAKEAGVPQELLPTEQATSGYVLRRQGDLDVTLPQGYDEHPHGCKCQRVCGGDQ